MAALTGSSIASTYTQLLKITSASLGADASAKYIEDGAGTDSALSLSTTRVGIGTAAPEANLHLSSDSGADVYFSSHNNTDSSSSRLFFLKSGGTAASPTVVAENEMIGSIWAYGHDGGNYESAAAIVFDVDGEPATGGDTSDMPGRIEFHTTLDGENALTERLRIDSDGDVTVKTGDLIMGTSGKGISFAATSDAGGMTSEVLDDYEEGTFEGALESGGGSITMNSSFTLCSYTKIGRLVHVHGGLYVSSVSSPTGDLTITGLPFTCASESEWAERSAVSLWMYTVNDTGGNPYYGEMVAGTSIGISEFDGIDNQSLAVHVKANTYCSFSLTYHV